MEYLLEADYLRRFLSILDRMHPEIFLVAELIWVIDAIDFAFFDNNVIRERSECFEKHRS